MFFLVNQRKRGLAARRRIISGSIGGCFFHVKDVFFVLRPLAAKEIPIWMPLGPEIKEAGDPAED